MAMTSDYELTPREHILMQAEQDENQRSREHAIKMKELEIQLKREQNEADIQLRTLEAKWSSWLRLPAMIIKWPLYPLFGIAYIAHVIVKKEPPKRFWDFIK